MTLDLHQQIDHLEQLATDATLVDNSTWSRLRYAAEILDDPDTQATGIHIPYDLADELRFRASTLEALHRENVETA